MTRESGGACRLFTWLLRSSVVVPLSFSLSLSLCLPLSLSLSLSLSISLSLFIHHSRSPYFFSSCEVGQNGPSSRFKHISLPRELSCVYDILSIVWPCRCGSFLYYHSTVNIDLWLYSSVSEYQASILRFIKMEQSTGSLCRQNYSADVEAAVNKQVDTLLIIAFILVILRWHWREILRADHLTFPVVFFLPCRLVFFTKSESGCCCRSTSRCMPRMCTCLCRATSTVTTLPSTTWPNGSASRATRNADTQSHLWSSRWADRIDAQITCNLY